MRREARLRHCLAVQVMNGEEDGFLSVKEMADLLFNDTSPGYCYASHRLLSEDRTFFKQVGRLPPKFAARSQLEVAAIQKSNEAKLKVTTFHILPAHMYLGKYDHPQLTEPNGGMAMPDPTSSKCFSWTAQRSDISLDVKREEAKQVVTI